MAQKRSGSVSAVMRRGRPSASTMSKAVTLSATQPWVRPNQLSPPPRATPVTLTTGELPGRPVRPCGAAAAWRSPEDTPAPTRARRATGSIWRSQAVGAQEDGAVQVRGGAVAVGLGRDGRSAVAGEADDGRDVGGVGRFDHGGNGLVDGEVPGSPRLVETVVAGKQDPSADDGAQVVELTDHCGPISGGERGSQRWLARSTLVRREGPINAALCKNREAEVNDMEVSCWNVTSWRRS